MARENGMIIAFDTLLLSRRYRHSGIHEYARNLFEELRKLIRGDDRLGFRHFVSRGYSDEALDWRSTFGYQSVDTPLLKFHRVWQLGAASVAAAMAGADVIFSPGPTILPSGLLPAIVTIHDAMPAKLPSSVIPKSALAKAANWFAAKWSRKVLTDSESSKRDLVEVYDLPPEKVSVVYLGYASDTFNTAAAAPDRQAALFRANGIRPPYIFHHGMVQHRKNLLRLIQAYRLFRRNNQGSGAQLVLAGGFGFGAEEIRREAQKNLADGQVAFTGPLPAEDLATLTKGAALSVIPSLYEGFCLPLIESMACGVPTIASDTSCIPEVSGGALAYFDPYSIESMAAQIGRAFSDAQLRDKLRTKGLERARAYSWQRCARETLAVFKECAA
jgi:glycosyltransferase involved in cell wall biosynthesis